MKITDNSQGFWSWFLCLLTVAEFLTGCIFCGLFVAVGDYDYAALYGWCALLAAFSHMLLIGSFEKKPSGDAAAKPQDPFAMGGDFESDAARYGADASFRTGRAKKWEPQEQPLPLRGSTWAVQKEEDAHRE